MATEEEKLKAEIAKLSGAIQTHKQHQHHPPAYQSYASGYAPRGRGYYPSAGAPSYRGGYAAHSRGRGRGAASAPLRNRTLILNDTNTKPASGAHTESKHGEGTGAASASSSTAPTDGWVKRKSTHNMSLVSTSTFNRTEPARLAALEATRKAKAEAKAASSSSAVAKNIARGKPSKPSSSVRRGDNMGEVVIDGVVFEFDTSGTKLVKKAVQPTADSPDDSAAAAASGPSSSPSSSAVPLKTSINGQDYIRTKRGNLISAELLAKRRAQREAAAKMGRLDKMVGQISAIQATRNASTRVKAGSSSRTLDVKRARTLCTFFNKTGQCKRGLSCPYLHDSSKIALCPKVLRPSGCTLPKGTCPLSHTPRAERVPHCVHYLRSRKCRNGDDCLYTHSDKLKEGVKTKICRDFSDYGWCEKGKDCQERHTYECPDFVEKGKCDRKGCKLVHVIRATDANTSDAQETKEAGEGEDADGTQDGDIFMRDDAAAAEESEAEAESGRTGKRKRPLMQTELDEDQLLPNDDDDGEEDEAADERLNFADRSDSRSTKRRKAKAFTQQRDFISFDDEKEEEEEEGDDDDNVEEAVSEDDEEGEEEALEIGSVHSEELEVSDVEEAEDFDEDQQAATSGDEEEGNDSEEGQSESAELAVRTHQEGDVDEANESDDDDLVDRDL